MRTSRLLPIALLAVLALVVGLAYAPAPSSLDDQSASSPVSETTHAPVLVGRIDVTTTNTRDVADETAPSDDGSADAGTTPSDDVEAEIDDSRRMGMRLTADHSLVAPVIRVQDRHTADLMRRPLVVGTATGMNARGEICVLVLTKEAVADLPAFLDGVPVEQLVTGEIFAGKKGGEPGPPGGGGNGGGGGEDVDPTARFDRPVPIGISTGHPLITAGTIGCRLTDGSGGYWALSNNHVYANSNGANAGDAVIQPGTIDGGASSADDIGNLDDWVTIYFNGDANTVDAAIASTSTGEVGNATPADGYGTPKSATVDPALNDRVTKYGRTTGETNGRIQGINASVNVNYSGAGVALFVDQIVIGGGGFSKGGDSGSLIVIQKGGDARKPVGLLFAGGAGATIANEINAVLSEFSGLSVDGD